MILERVKQNSNNSSSAGKYIFKASRVRYKSAEIITDKLTTLLLQYFRIKAEDKGQKSVGHPFWITQKS